MRTLSAIALAATMLAWSPRLSAQSTVSSTEPPDPICVADRSDDDKTIAHVDLDTLDIRRLSSMIAVHHCWAADLTNDRQYFLNDLYSRWTIQEVGHERQDLARDYRAERISPLARLFVGKTRGIVMSVKLRMRDPDVEFTIPLIALDYSAKVGEAQSFVTSFTASEMGLPDFRMSPGTSVSVEANARLTHDVDVQSTGIVLGALRDTLTLVAPGGSLLTSVNREQVQRISGAYDTALSKLLSSSISESAIMGRLTSEWYPSSSFLVSIYVPEEVRTSGRAKNATPPRHLWFRLSMACPRLSIYDTTNLCSPKLRPLMQNPYRAGAGEAVPGTGSLTYRKYVDGLGPRISANQVLAFRVGPNRTVRQYLTEQEWFISLSKKIVTPTKTAKDAIKALDAEDLSDAMEERQLKILEPESAAAAEFCDAVVDKLYLAGLSRLDAKIGLWAVATGIPDFYASREIFQQSDGCRADLPSNGEGVWAFAPSEAASEALAGR